MSRTARTVFVAGLVAAAFVATAALVPTATASGKDDPAAITAMREKVRTELKTKKMYPFSDLRFYVPDFTKMKEQRWDIKDVNAPATPEDAGLVFHAEIPGSNPNDATPSVRLIIQRWPHFKQQGSQRAGNSLPFKNWGKSVDIKEWKLIAEGFYQDWIREATEVQKEKSKVPDERGAVGPAKMWGYATALDKESKKRERRDWYGWVTNDPPVPFTYLAAFVVSDMKLADNDDFMVKLTELIKNIKELKDPRLK